MTLPAFAEEVNWAEYSTETTTAAAEVDSGAVAEILSPTDGTSSSGVNIAGKDALTNSSDEAANIYSGYVDIIPKVSTDDLLQWATTKGNEIIYLLQIICQPITIICFIIAAFITLIGSISKGSHASAGVWGMLCSILVYAAVLYAPVILQTFVGWVAS